MIQNLANYTKNLSSAVFHFVKKHWKITLFIISIIIIAYIFLAYSSSNSGVSQEIIDQEKENIIIQTDNNNKELTNLERELLLIDEELHSFDTNALEKEDNQINTRLDIVIDKYKYLVNEQ